MSSPRAKKRSIYDGVFWNENTKRWRTQVKSGRTGNVKTHYNGTFTNEKDAAKAYLEAKIKLYQEKLKDIS